MAESTVQKMAESSESRKVDHSDTQKVARMAAHSVGLTVEWRAWP